MISYNFSRRWAPFCLIPCLVRFSENKEGLVISMEFIYLNQNAWKPWSFFVHWHNPDFGVGWGKMSFQSHDERHGSDFVPRGRPVLQWLQHQLFLSFSFSHATPHHPPPQASLSWWKSTKQRIPQMSEIATSIFQKLCRSLAKLHQPPEICQECVIYSGSRDKVCLHEK